MTERDINSINDLSPLELVSMVKRLKKDEKDKAIIFVISKYVSMHPEILFNQQNNNPIVKFDGGDMK